MVANPDCGQLNRELGFAPENLASRDRLGHHAPRQPRSFSTSMLNLVPTHGLLSFLLFSAIQTMTIKVSIYTYNCHRVSPEFIGLRNFVSMAFNHRHPSGVVYWFLTR